MGLRAFLPFLAAHQVGGQAVIEGVMMRSGDKLAIAVRRPDGDIHVELRPWFSLTRAAWLKKPFVRGFPVLIETMVNGVKALNFSAKQAVDEDEGELNTWHMVLTMAAAIGLALGLFVALPHLMSLAMQWAGLGGDLNSLSFHAWDGLFKFALFIGYIASISLVPDIKRVFQYHGAEHKVIWAFESGAELSPSAAKPYSRLHPRCGTAFLLFVLGISILLFAVLVPGVLWIWSPENPVAKHAYVLAVKLLLMAPISAVAYEMIRVAGKFHENVICKAACLPGLLMQVLTTKEPDESQIEVAIAALNRVTAEKA